MDSTLAEEADYAFGDEVVDLNTSCDLLPSTYYQEGEGEKEEEEEEEDNVSVGRRDGGRGEDSGGKDGWGRRNELS